MDTQDPQIVQRSHTTLHIILYFIAKVKSLCAKSFDPVFRLKQEECEDECRGGTAQDPDGEKDPTAAVGPLAQA